MATGGGGGAGWESSDGRLAPGAAWYASVGWKVFPCWGIAGGRCACGGSHREAKDWGKHPHGRLVGAGGDDGGYKAATSDVDVVRAWWAADPEANVALACRPSGILVLDADPRHGGDASLEILEKEIGGLPATVEAVTGEYTLKGRVVRGRHVLLRVDPSLELVGKLKELPGIDIKWNGYVLIAPSRHGSGIVYQWAQGRAPWEHGIAEAPEELMQLLVRKGSGSSSGGGGGGYGTLDWSGEKLDVDAILEAGIPDGERMVTLYKLACAFANQYPVGTEHGRASVMRVMAEINAQRVFPPMGWGDGGPDDLKPHVAKAIEFVRANPKKSSGALATVMTPEMQAWAAAQPVAGGGGSGDGGGDDAVGDALAFDWDTIPPPGNEGNGAVVRRSLTDTGNAARLVDYYAHDVKHTGGEGWFVWEPGSSATVAGREISNGIWRCDPRGSRALELSSVLFGMVMAESNRLGFSHTDAAAEQYARHAIRSKSKAARASAVSLWQTDTHWTSVDADAWDANPLMLGAQNGVVNLQTGDLVSGTPEQLITRRVNVAYTQGQRNIRWEQFLDDATGGDKELQSWLQLAAGYTLTGLQTYDALFLVFGPPGSGKSTFLDALSAVMGEYHWVLPTQVVVDNKGMVSSSDEYHWAKLRGRRMVVLSEFPESKNIKEDAIKRITGDALVNARLPAQDPINFTSQAKIWVGTNHLPIIKDEAMWRRIRAIPFKHVPEKPDPDLREYLKNPELGGPAVLAWAVEGAVKILGASVREPLSVNACRAVRDASSEYRKNEDRLGIFFENELVIEPGVTTAVPQFYRTYKRWSEDRGESGMSLTALMKRVRERGVEVTGTGSRRDHVVGVRLQDMSLGHSSGVEDWEASITSMLDWGRR